MRNVRNGRPRWLQVLAATAGLMSFALAAAAEPPRAQAPAGQIAAVDAHGKLRQPTREEALMVLHLRKLLRRESADRVVQSRPDGTQWIDLSDTFLDVALARLNPDGTLAQACVDSLDSATNFLLNPPPALEE